MSIRIHELAKRYNMEGKDMLALLKERGYVSADTRSVSSTVSNIYVDEIEKELSSRVTPAAVGAEGASVATAALPLPPRPPAPDHGEAQGVPVSLSAPASATEPGAGRVRLPAGIFVKSADDIVKEKEAVAKAAAAASAAQRPAPVPAVPPSAPAVLKSPAPPPPRPAVPTRTSIPVPSVQPVPVSRPSSPPPLPTPHPSPFASPAPVLRAAVSSPPPGPAPAPSLPPLPTGSASAAVKSPSAPLPPPRSFAPRPLPPSIPSSVPVVTIQGDVKVIHLKPPVIVRDFAAALGLKPFKLISELNQLVGFASMNSTIDDAVAQKVAEKYGFLIEIKHRGDSNQQQVQKDKEKTKKQPVPEDEAKNHVLRPPVVCILGHVDHGKTSLLDAIRKADVAAGEAGGITQHIGAYQIEHNGRKITFLDTPGHAAFTQMRSRGASGADVGILVVAADDGFMPQTDEALKIALGVKQQSEKFALLVAVNKMDVKGANLEHVKVQMQQKGIPPEDWGGETVTVPVSAIKGTGITDLLEMIILQADVLELKANPKGDVSGIIIESEIEVGRGPLATVIVQQGTLRVGDSLVCGAHWAKVRAMFDDQGKPLKEAPPSTPARVIGWSGTPDSGAVFRSAKNAREAENLAEEEAERLKKVVSVAGNLPKDVSIEQLFANIAANQQKTLKVIVKTDVFGSAEAIRNILDGIKTTKVTLEIVSAEVGLVTKNDVIMASASGAVVLGFNTKLENGVTPLAKHQGVKIETFAIIYELGDRVREMMADLLDPESRETKLGAVEVRATFPLAKGFVAGCLVTEGKVGRNASARLRRGKEVVYEGKIGTLKRFKDDANEVRAGLECGIKLDDFNGYQVGDVIECYEIQKVRASL